MIVCGSKGVRVSESESESESDSVWEGGCV